MRSLIPLSVCIYTVFGGLKATFTSSYLHTVIIYVTVCLFAFKFYASGIYPVGSIGQVWDNLQLMAENLPVAGMPPHSSFSSNLKVSFYIWSLTLIRVTW